MLLSTLYFFLIMAGYFIIRPLRDDMGLAGGVRNLPWLYTGTLVGMLLIQPVFATMVSKLSRRRFISLSYHLVAGLMLVFFVLLTVLSEAQIIWVGRAFWVFTSIFNLFVVSVFWSVMADTFRPDQSARLFGFIAVGGTAGAIAGSAVTAGLAEEIPTRFLLFASVALIEAAIMVALVLLRRPINHAPDGTDDQPSADEIIGGDIWSGITAVFRSPYLMGIVTYMLLYTITATFLYFEQAEIVAEVFADRGARTAFFAKLDLAVNTLTIVTQIFLTGRIVRWFGIAFSLAWLLHHRLFQSRLRSNPHGHRGVPGLSPRLQLRRSPALPRDALHRAPERDQVQGEELHRHLRLSRGRPGRRLVLRRHGCAGPRDDRDRVCGGAAGRRVDGRRPLAREATGRAEP